MHVIHTRYWWRDSNALMSAVKGHCITNRIRVWENTFFVQNMSLGVIHSRQGSSWVKLVFVFFIPATSSPSNAFWLLMSPSTLMSPYCHTLLTSLLPHLRTGPPVQKAATRMKLRAHDWSPSLHCFSFFTACLSPSNWLGCLYLHCAPNYFSSHLTIHFVRRLIHSGGHRTSGTFPGAGEPGCDCQRLRKLKTYIF